MSGQNEKKQNAAELVSTCQECSRYKFIHSQRLNSGWVDIRFVHNATANRIKIHGLVHCTDSNQNQQEIPFKIFSGGNVGTVDLLRIITRKGKKQNNGLSKKRNKSTEFVSHFIFSLIIWPNIQEHCPVQTCILDYKLSKVSQNEMCTLSGRYPVWNF